MRAEVAEVARLIARAGLVDAFGHVSARTGDGFLLTSTAPLRSQTEESIHQLGPEGGAGDGIPLEAPLHAAIYAARPEVGAICRTHSSAAVVWGVRGAVPPLLHGLAGLAGTVAAWGDDGDLVTDAARGAAVAAGLGAADCLLLRANGNVATGATPRQAAVRAWFLEERARVALEAGVEAAPQIDFGRRSRHFAAEEARAWSWLREAFA